MLDTWIIISGAVVLALLIVVALVQMAESRRQSRQSRLDEAYARARRVRYAGTGEQGRPYSLYTDRVNQW